MTSHDKSRMCRYVEPSVWVSPLTADHHTCVRASCLRLPVLPTASTDGELRSVEGWECQNHTILLSAGQLLLLIWLTEPAFRVSLTQSFEPTRFPLVDSLCFTVCFSLQVCLPSRCTSVFRVTQHYHNSKTTVFGLTTTTVGS